MNKTDVVIIGAGHNGLTCAAYLAMAGLRVKVVERRKVVGGQEDMIIDVALELAKAHAEAEVTA